eukprot:TRINITY_DN3828_c0_g1_i3.p1 TRINITY_DN3828_c0_g1~~TRINITY_DN3828_c0_g1_i3.p1  ORF type:complete len:491 (+),score=81.63 TRINITY_DN3828_c0_g1_i3:92-1564(+)
MKNNVIAIGLLLLLCLSMISYSEGDDKAFVLLKTSSAQSKPINPRFASFSYEQYWLTNMIGRYPDIKPGFLQIMKNLGQYAGANPAWRIGGDSTDNCWWDPTNATKPTGISYNIQPYDYITFNEMAKALDTHLILGVNFRNPESAAWALGEVEAIATTIGWDNVYAIEIGNEPDMYVDNKIRPVGFNATTYTEQFDAYYQAISSHLPSKPFIQGGTWCCSYDWSKVWQEYIGHEGASVLKTVSYHKYPIDACANHKPTLEDLMQDRATIGEAQGQARAIAYAHTLGIEYYMGEVNSVACGGRANVSDVFGATLWTLDYLLNFANVSADGMNFHQGGHYGGWGFDVNTSAPILKPPYYGFYMFDQAIQGGASMMPSITKNTTNPFIKTFAMLGSGTDKSVRVIIIHKDITTNQTAEVQIEIDDAANYEAVAAMYVLEAPSPYASTGISLAGQTFDGTKDGTVQGTRTPVKVQGSGPGVFMVIHRFCNYILQ